MVLKDFISSIYMYDGNFGSFILCLVGVITALIGIIFIIWNNSKLIGLFCDASVIETNDVLTYIIWALFGLLMGVNGIITTCYSLSCGKIQLVQDVNTLTYEETQELSSVYDVEIKGDKIFITLNLSELDYFTGNEE